MNLPPDPDGQNDDRAEWANTALSAFQNETNTDDEDLVADLLADLLHWCDRHGVDFEKELRRGRGMYSEETGGPANLTGFDPMDGADWELMSKLRSQLEIRTDLPFTVLSMAIIRIKRLAHERDLIVDAARRLVKAKGRFHTEQNYRALADALDRLENP